MCFAPQRRALFRHFFDIFTSKKAQNLQFFTLLTSKCASRHNGVHFFDTFSTSELPKVVNTFDLEMCFAPQRRALFRHLNFQKSSDTEVFCTFWLQNVLRATTACTFSTSELPKVVREWCVFVHFDFKMCFAPQRRALFRHRNFQKWSENGVFCTFWLQNVLRATTVCKFSSLIWPAGSAPAALASLLFDPPEPQIIRKTQCLATFPTFSRICIFCLLALSLLLFFLLIFLFSLPLPCSAFHLSILSEVWLLNFLRICDLVLLKMPDKQYFF